MGRNKMTDNESAGVGMDTEYTDNIKCPFCGYEDMDSWESNDCDGTAVNCGECGGEFELTVHVEVTYTTNKLKGNKNDK